MARNQHHDEQDQDEQDKRLIRRLLGELSRQEAEQLRREEREDPAFGGRAARFQAAWDQLVAPDLAAPDLTPRIMAAIRSETEGSIFGWWQAPAWARLCAAAMLMLGIGLGARFGEIEPQRLGETLAASSQPWQDEDAEGFFPSSAPSLTDAYWQVLEETEGRLSGLEEAEPVS